MTNWLNPTLTNRLSRHMKAAAASWQPKPAIGNPTHQITDAALKASIKRQLERIDAGFNHADARLASLEFALKAYLRSADKRPVHLLAAHVPEYCNTPTDPAGPSAPTRPQGQGVHQ